MSSKPDVTVQVKVVPQGRLALTLSFQRSTSDVEPKDTDFYNEPPTASQDLYLTAADLVV